MEVRQQDATRSPFLQIAAFVTIAAVTVIIAVNLASFKGGVFNLMYVIGGLLVLLLVGIALPQLKTNASYLRARLNWWHFLWFLIYVSALVFRVRDMDQFRSTPVDGWAMFRILPEMFLGLYLLLSLAMRRLNWLSSLLQGIPGALALYAFYCTISTMWSIFGAFTFYKSVEFLLDVSVLSAILCALTTAEQYKVFFDFTWTVYAIEAAWCWCQVVIWPSEVLIDGRLKGVFPMTAYNAVGEYGAVLCIVALCRMVPIQRGVFQRSWYACLFIFGLATLLFSQTRNTIFGLAGAIIVVLLLARGFRGVMAVLLSAGIFIFTALGSFSYKWLQRGQGDEAFTELSGRLEWWHAAWVQFTAHPITGMGAYAGGKFVVLKSLGVNASSTHSDYIELLVGSGVIGTALFVIAIIWTTALLFGYARNKSLPVAEQQLSLEAFGILIVLVVHSFFNVELIWHAPLFFLIVLGWAELLRRKQKERAQLAFRRQTATARPTPMYAMN